MSANMILFLDAAQMFLVAYYTYECVTDMFLSHNLHDLIRHVSNPMRQGRHTGRSTARP